MCLTVKKVGENKQNHRGAPKRHEVYEVTSKTASYPELPDSLTAFLQLSSLYNSPVFPLGLLQGAANIQIKARLARRI